ncbi:MAG TPA: ATP-binding protein [Candidatus Manganitrophaceae bacterium]|nr:ATP-binding protein [Candidatus Manganitrophaceae bacterium]
MIRYFLNHLNLTTKLVLMMLLLSLLSLGASYVYNVRSEREFMKKVEDNIGDLSTAIKISVEELTSAGRTDEARLADYVTRLKNRGVKEISIISNEKEVIASSNPKRIGSKIDPKIDPKHKDLFITAKLGDDQDAASLREYNLIVPIVVDGAQLGFVHIDMRLEDYGQFLKENHRRRLVTTLIIFAAGIGFSIFLSIKYTRPIDEVVRAAKKIASGDLTQTLPEQRKDEIGELIQSFNEMVERLRRQRELEERLRQAEQLSVLGQMASGIAHEIRNPLNLISLSIDHLRSQFSSWDRAKQEESEEIISNVKIEIYRLNQMIENFLRYGKPLRLHYSEVSVKLLLQEVIGLAQHKAVEQRVEIVVDGETDLPRMSLDPEQIKTCFMNVILNAIQAMPYGGKLEIQIRRSLVFYPGRKGGEPSLFLIFRDTGIGIDEEDQRKIFEPYFTTKKLGIGLGLALTKKILEEHGGVITVQSRPKHGTEVAIQIPIRFEAREERVELESAPSREAGGLESPEQTAGAAPGIASRSNRAGFDS